MSSISLKNIVRYALKPTKIGDIPADIVALYHKKPKKGPRKKPSIYVFERTPSEVLEDGRQTYTQSEDFRELIFDIQQTNIKRIEMSEEDIEDNTQSVE